MNLLIISYWNGIEISKERFKINLSAHENETFPNLKTDYRNKDLQNREFKDQFFDSLAIDKLFAVTILALILPWL